MKKLIPLITLVCCTAAVRAGTKGIQASPTNNPDGPAKTKDAGEVHLQLANIDPLQHADSVLIIFDRFDRSGAGVIYQIFNADQKSGIDIHSVPAGRYFVTIQCLGLHHDRIQKTITVRKNKEERISISLSLAELFCKDRVVIPPYHCELAKLSILR